MASQRDVAISQYEIDSVVCGHHVYKTLWRPFEGEILRLSKEHCNAYDKHAVSVMKEHSVVGHVPIEFRRAVWHFLSHGGSAHCKVTGHRKKGKGLEVPCKFVFRGRKTIISRLQKLISPSSTSIDTSCNSWS